MNEKDAQDAEFRKFDRNRSVLSNPLKSLAEGVVVTGATGFIGRCLCARLLELGVFPRALVRREDPTLRRSGVDLRIVDFNDADVVARELEGSRVIFHCAANATFGNGQQYEHDNVDTTRVLLDAAQSCVSRFVFLSTIGAVDRATDDDCSASLTESTEPHPSTDYGRSKLACELLLQESGLPYVILRPSMVVGTGMRADSHFAAFANMALRGSLFARIRWPGAMSIIHVDDLVEAIIHCAVHPDSVNRTFFCAGNQIEIGEYFSQVTPTRRMINIKSVVRLMRLLAVGLPFKFKALLLPALTASDEALRATGWAPTKSVTESLREVIDRERMRLDPLLDPGGITVVTGAASGLGKAFVETLAPVRQLMLLIDQDERGLAQIASTFPHCQTMALDLSSENELQKFLDSIADKNISELFACAGVGARGPVQQLGFKRQKNVFSINVLARMAMATAFATQMLNRHFGRIVFISSSSAFQPLPYMAVYAASNSALLSLGEAWGAELRKSGVRLLTVCPGGMKTNFQKSSGVKELKGEKLMSPEEVVLQTMRSLRRNRLSTIVSFRSFAMSLIARVLPRELSAMLWMRLMDKMR